jgi:hypothetical protein
VFRLHGGENKMDYITLPVTLSDGSILLVEVTPKDDEQNVSWKSKFHLSDSLNTMKSVIQDFVEPLAELRLGKMTIEVGFGFEVEAGKIVSVLCNSSSSFSVKLIIEFNSK